MKIQKPTGYKIQTKTKAGADPRTCDMYTMQLKDAHKQCEIGDCFWLSSLITYIPDVCQNYLPPPN